MTGKKTVKRAVSYLRVSTKAQAMRDGNPEGLLAADATGGGAAQGRRVVSGDC